MKWWRRFFGGRGAEAPRPKVAPPRDWASASRGLRPRVTNRGPLALGQLQARALGTRSTPGAYVPLTEHLALSLVVDTPEGPAPAGWERCEAWGVTREQALSVAVENLARVSQEPLRFRGVLFASAWQDGLDASRLTLIERLAGLPVKGELVALVPHPNHLFLTGSEDKAGLAQLLWEAEQLSADPDFMGFYPVVLKEKGWRTFRLPEKHPLAGRYQLLEVWQLVRLYEEQQQWLRAALSHEEVRPYVATYAAYRSPEQAFSRACWAKGIPTLLPRADAIILVENDETGEPRIEVPWEVLQRHAGHLLVRDENLYPERYQALHFPSDILLEALRRELDSRPGGGA